MVRELPTGTVTFLFTDIEGSTRLLQELGDGYAAVLAEHHRVLRAVWRAASRGRGRHAGRCVLRRLRAGVGRRGGRGARRSAPWRADRCACGWGCTRASRSWTSKATSASTCTARRGSQPRGTAGRCCCRRRRPISPASRFATSAQHRLKDLSAPERLFQLGTDVFPPLKTLHETNLPVPATPFLGREQEIDELDGPATAARASAA